MGYAGSSRFWWVAPVGLGLIGLALSCLAFWLAARADHQRVETVLESRSEWRARDIQAKVRLSANAVENIAIAMATDRSPTPAEFATLAARATRGLYHVNSLQWAPRVARGDIARFEEQARSLGLENYTVFDVTPDFQRTELSDRLEYFPVLFDERFSGGKPVLGLALGKYEGRRVPMELARDDGGAVATLPVRPIGPAAARLVYLVIWPVYDTIDIPASLEERRARLRGYAIGNYDLAALLTGAMRDTPDLIETIHFSVATEHQDNSAENALAVYSPATGLVDVRGGNTELAERPVVRIERDFMVFHQHWDLTFDYSASAVAALRSQGASGWLAAGLLLTASLVYYLLRERGQRRRIEMVVLARTTELQRTTEQLHQAQKMDAIGNLTGGMAHDFNNLLSIVIGNLDLIEPRIKNDPEAAALAEAALQASLRGAELTRQLLAFARRQPLAPQVTDVNELVAGTAKLLERILEQNVEMTLAIGQGVWPVLVDPAQLSAAIANLATNARDAMPKGGRLTIETGNARLDADYAALNSEVTPGDYVLLEVSDTGIGMSAATMSKVFEPFFTTKAVGHGTGLGLSMVFGFVKQSRGHIKIYSELGHGTTIRIYLPRADREAAAVAAPELESAPSQVRQETILVVEDDGNVRQMVIRQLRDLGYSVLEADSAHTALTALKANGSTVDLLFTDIMMPGGMSGSELARAAVAERPGLNVLFTSGYPGNALRSDDRLKDREHFISKPYRKQDLARKLREILDR